MSSHSQSESQALGAQLYTVREQIRTSPQQTLEEIASIGYSEVEALQADLARIVPLARDVGLSVVSVHIEPSSVAPALTHPNVDSLDRMFDWMRALGVAYAVLGYLGPDARGKTASEWRRWCDFLNDVGERARRAGLIFGYHNHGFEFAKLGDGSRPLDVLVDSLDPEVVVFELDVFWASLAGVDPVELLHSLGDRVHLLHLKDRAAGTPVETDDRRVAPGAFAEVGTGTLDFANIVATARKTNGRHLFVEQDFTLGHPLGCLRSSYNYLRALSALSESVASSKRD